MGPGAADVGDQRGDLCCGIVVRADGNDGVEASYGTYNLESPYPVEHAGYGSCRTVAGVHDDGVLGLNNVENETRQHLYAGETGFLRERQVAVADL